MPSEGKSGREQDSSPDKNRRILIVDGDETILHLLGRFFVAKGFQVSVAGDGFRAMEQFMRETPAVVLTDLRMPCLSGFDWIQWILQHSKEIPIVIMTAYPHLCPEKKVREEVKGYFVKPFDIDDVLSSIRQILGG